MISCKKILLYLLLSIGIFVNSFAANELVSVGRYTTVTHKPLSYQRDLLSQSIQIRFPLTVKTIGAAMDHILRYSGYSLVIEVQRSPALKNTLQKPLPLIDREFGPMPLRDALTTLIGPAFTLIEDPLNREIDFQLKPNFSHKLRAGA